MANAAEKELAAGKVSVEPGHTIYGVEQLGELLLELDRPKEALAAFRRSLADSPKRFHSLFGAGRAAEMASMDEEAGEYPIPYLNRLSDALFVMARYENKKKGVEDVLWDSRA